MKAKATVPQDQQKAADEPPSLRYVSSHRELIEEINVRSFNCAVMALEIIMDAAMDGSEAAIKEIRRLADDMILLAGRLHDDHAQCERRAEEFRRTEKGGEVVGMPF